LPVTTIPKLVATGYSQISQRLHKDLNTGANATEHQAAQAKWRLGMAAHWFEIA
tara:strand:- start:1 stop:162 length:162 start_codon:yes stop_codon:yes gene_type:complete